MYSARSNIESTTTTTTRQCQQQLDSVNINKTIHINRWSLHNSDSYNY